MAVLSDVTDVCQELRVALESATSEMGVFVNDSNAAQAAAEHRTADMLTERLEELRRTFDDTLDEAEAQV